MAIPAGFKPVLVTTEHRGVFGGLVPDTQDMNATTIALTEGRMAIRWGTSRGVLQLAATGPTGESRIGAPADIPAIHKITLIANITPEAWAKWQAE